MAKRTWQVILEDGSHQVELHHTYFGGKRLIWVDGEKIVEERNLFDMGSTHGFVVSDHPCRVEITTNGVTFNYDLIVDDRSMTTGLLVGKPLPVPWWGWLFVAACALIPLASLGGAIPVMLGAGGAMKCHRVSRNGSLSEGSRIAQCLGFTLLFWAFLGVFLFVLGPMLQR